MRYLFYGIVFACALQRLMEILHSLRNQRALRKSGFVKVEPKSELGIMIALHIGWFLAMLLERQIFDDNLPRAVSLIAVVLFVAAQALRLWVLSTLGRQWNISIMAPSTSVSEAQVVVTGPYRYIRHPNYLAIVIEVATLPLIGGAWRTALLFSLLNADVLRRRIEREERYLFSRPGYAAKMQEKGRLIPRRTVWRSAAGRSV